MNSYPASHKLTSSGKEISHAHKENKPAIDIPQHRKAQKRDKYKQGANK